MQGAFIMQVKERGLKPLIRATTPTHIFNLPIDTSTISKLLISYKQGDNIVLEKTEADCTLTSSKVELTLTQEAVDKFRKANDWEKANYLKSKGIKVLNK